MTLFPIRIRFVGGGRHNRIVDVSELREEYLVVTGNQPIDDFSDFENIRPHQFTYSQERYLLCGFRTEWGTVYHQYVLESLTHRDIDLLSCCTEIFPRMDLLNPIW